MWLNQTSYEVQPCRDTNSYFFPKGLKKFLKRDHYLGKRCKSGGKISGLDIFIIFEFKGPNFTDSTVWNTGETGDIYYKNGTTSLDLFVVRSKHIRFGNIRSILVFPTLAWRHSIDLERLDQSELIQWGFAVGYFLINLITG